MKPIRTILLPTDFGPADEAAMDVAVELADKLGAHVELLHVWSIPPAVYTEAFTWPVTDFEREAGKALADAFAALTQRHADAQSILTSGDPAKRILEIIGNHGATGRSPTRSIDLVVMGTHGRHGLPRLLLGSVAERVVRMSPVPVLTVSERAAGGEST